MNVHILPHPDSEPGPSTPPLPELSISEPPPPEEAMPPPLTRQPQQPRVTFPSPVKEAECQLPKCFFDTMPPMPEPLERPLYDSTGEAVRDIAISMLGAFALGAVCAFSISYFSKRSSEY